jgi:outer membrane receptor protein involved in Fe transport
MKRAASTILLLGALLSSTALAQGTAVLTGKITDAATNAPVPDVVVTATSPRLQGEQIVVSDSTGTYRIPQLPPGIYSLRYEKEGYKPYSRAGLDVRADVTLRVNTLLLPSELGTTIEVVGTPPVIDVGSTSIGSDIGQDFVNNLALSRPGSVGGAARSFESLALTVPQATGDAFGVSVNGATAPENSYLVDGLSVNNTAYGINGSSLPIDFMDDVNVITGGYMPEYGKAMGGTISATTKSGGNEFHGSVFFNIAPGSLASEGTRIQSDATVLSSKTSPFNIGDLGATLGGPIIKDRLWFFAGIQPTFTRYKSDINITPIVDNSGESPVFADAPALSYSRFSDDRQLNYLAKLTYLLNADNRLSLSWNGTLDKSGGNGSFAFGNGGDGYDATTPEVFPSGTYESSATQNTNSNNALTLKLNSGFMDKRLLVDASVGWFHQSVSSLPVDGSQIGDTDPNALVNIPSISWSRRNGLGTFIPALATACADPTACPGGYTTGGPGYISDASLNNYQGKLVVTYLMTLLGHHVWKAGVDGSIATYDQTQAYTGGYALVQSTALPGQGLSYFYRVRQYSDYVGPGEINVRPFYKKSTKSMSGGYFLQDSWQILDKVTLNAGIRVDNQSLYGADDVNGLTLANEISPRLGLIWDPTQSGKSKIFASYAKYYENIPLDLANRGLSGEQAILYDYYNSNVGDAGCIPGQIVNKGCGVTHLPLVVDPTNPNQAGSDYGISRDAIDPNISAPANSEIVAGGEYEVFPNARVGLTYTHRELSTTIEDLSTSGGATFFLGNPGEGAASAFPKATRIYNAGTLTLTKSFSNLWLFQGSYTYAHAFGNYDGLVARDYGQLDPNITANFDLIQLLVNSNGPLSVDIQHTIKLYAAKEFPIAGGLSVTLGANYVGESGPPTSYLGYNANPGYGTGAVFILPRGSGQRLPWYNDVDGHLAVNYRLSKDSVLSASIDAFNLFNFQGVTGTDQDYTVGPNGALPIPNGTPADLPNGVHSDLDGHILAGDELNPNFGNTTSYQSPRSIRLGVKLTF